MRSEILIHPEELSKRWIDRMANACITVMGIHPWDGKDAPQSPERLTVKFGSSALRRFTGK